MNHFTKNCNGNQKQDLELQIKPIDATLWGVFRIKEREMTAISYAEMQR